MNAETDALAIAFDEQYLTPACTMLTSLAESLHPPRTVAINAVMPESTSSTAIERLKMHADARNVWLKLHLVRQTFSALPVVEPYTRAIYLKLLLADLLTQVRRILYLDVDLIFTRDFSGLFDVDLGAAPLAAVRDVFIPHMPQLLDLNEEPAERQPGLPYFNAGVMVINADAWRSEHIGNRAMGFIQKTSPLPRWLDQDALNFLTAGRWVELAPEWNVFPVSDELGSSSVHTIGGLRPMTEQIQLETEAFILHFAGRRKPWHPGYPRTRNWDRYMQFAE